jgi:hypothetical protein
MSHNDIGLNLHIATNGNQGAEMYIDNVQYIPEPASALLMIMGMALITKKHSLKGLALREQ